LSEIAIGDPFDEGKNDGVVNEQTFFNTDTEMKNAGRDGK
jgi:hypothetical protein